MKRLVSPFAALLLSLWIINLGTGLQSTLLGMRASVEAFAIIETGLVMSAYFIGFIISSWITPGIINGVGHIRSFAAFASVASAATLCHAVLVEPVTWFILRLVTGICIGGLTMVGESWLNAASSNTQRGTLFSVYMMVALAAVAMSQSFINLADISGYDLFILVSVTMSLSLVPVAIARKVHTPELLDAPHMPFSTLVKRSPLGTFGAMVSGLVNGALWTMTAVYAVEIGLNTAQVSWVMMLLIGGGIVSLWPVGRISDRFDRRKVILGLGGVTALVSVAVAVLGGVNVTVLYALATLLGIAAFPLYGVAVAHANDFLDDSEFVPASASLILLFGFGAMVAPMLTAGAMWFMGPSGMFVYLLLTQLGLAAFAGWRIAHQDQVPAEEKGKFVPNVPKSVVSVSPLDPRAEGTYGVDEVAGDTA